MNRKAQIVSAIAASTAAAIFFPHRPAHAQIRVVTMKRIKQRQQLCRSCAAGCRPSSTRSDRACWMIQPPPEHRHRQADRYSLSSGSVYAGHHRRRDMLRCSTRCTARRRSAMARWRVHGSGTQGVIFNSATVQLISQARYWDHRFAGHGAKRCAFNFVRSVTIRSRIFISTTRTTRHRLDRPTKIGV